MNKEFAVHMLNDQGKEKAKKISEAFDRLLDELTGVNTLNNNIVAPLCPPGRETALVRTNLEIASFYAKKAMAMDKGNTE